VPDPLIVPIDAAAAEELPDVLEGHAVLVRAAARLGDDAFPSVVRCRVDGRPVALSLVPPRPGRAPALFGRIPALVPGEHRVEVEAFGRRVDETWRFGEPVERAADRGVPSAWLPPAVMTFEGVDAVPFLEMPLPFAVPDGSVAVSANRADVILSLDAAPDALGTVAMVTLPPALIGAAVLALGRLVYGEWEDRSPVLNASAAAIRIAGFVVAIGLGAMLLFLTATGITADDQIVAAALAVGTTAGIVLIVLGFRIRSGSGRRYLD
jgi:hypothetical protein